MTHSEHFFINNYLPISGEVNFDPNCSTTEVDSSIEDNGLGDPQVSIGKGKDLPDAPPAPKKRKISKKKRGHSPTSPLGNLTPFPEYLPNFPPPILNYSLIQRSSA